MSQRFENIDFDEESEEKYQALKVEFTELEEMILKNVASSRSLSLSLTHLEEAFMWLGKAIRDEQKSVCQIKAPLLDV